MLSCRREHITRRALVFAGFLFEGLRRAASLTRGLRTWEVYRALAIGIVRTRQIDRQKRPSDYELCVAAGTARYRFHRFATCAPIQIWVSTCAQYRNHRRKLG